MWNSHHLITQDQSKYFGSKDDTFHRCQVGDFARVQCGDPTFTKDDCEALNCCFDHQCYYANEATVHCLRDGQFRVVVSRTSTLPPFDYVYLSMVNGDSSATCSPIAASPAFTVFQFPVSSCATTMRMEGDYVIYENKILSTYGWVDGPLGSITRDTVFELSFQCRYYGTDVVSLVAEVNTVPPPLPVAAQGPLHVELRLASGQCDSKGAKGCADGDVYSDYYRDADYPVTKWSLLVDGCPYHADPYQTTLVPVDGASGLPFPTHYKRFMVQMFTFVDPASSIPLNEMVFIHCSTRSLPPPLLQNAVNSNAAENKEGPLFLAPLPQARGFRVKCPSLSRYVLLGVVACVLLVSTLALAVACTKPSRMKPKV
ncbi:hypothetical protein SKAU_G00240310 [Synaphobranchus kaupii]|uniref:Zona pellucida sperm-binding protein 4 n=1 Tax=Synaphobranchus kaupii TaxID=118154 RepID=A0A9Q1ITA1_SYNKA|nr:hypothetical protein SKAU_G00240310 [Synaphobranchus kaupii]